MFEVKQIKIQSGEGLKKKKSGIVVNQWVKTALDAKEEKEDPINSDKKDARVFQVRTHITSSILLKMKG